MKHFFPLAALSLVALAARPALAQSAITLTAATCPAAPGAVERYQPASGAAAPVLGANRTWDYRSLAPAGVSYTEPYLPVPAPNPLPGSQWVQTRGVDFGTLGYDYLTYRSLGTGGVLSLGRTIARQAYSIQPTTGNSTDSVVISRQTVAYSPVVVLPLPFTAGGYSNRSFRFGVTGTLTAAALGYNRAPLRIVQRIQYVDSVAGYGTLRVPVAGQSGGSPALAVLLLRSRVVRQDSFFLNNAPAPAALLAALGTSQGRVSPTYYDSFWRQGSVQSVLDVYYPNAQYGTPNAAYYSTEPTLLAARPAAPPAAWLAYPNPLPGTTDLVLGAGSAQLQPLTLLVRDALGRVVASGAGRSGQPTSLLRGLPSGCYLLEATTADGQRTVQRLAVE